MQDRLFWAITKLTRRLSDRQLMIILAMVVGVIAGFAAVLFEMLLHWIKAGLTSWFPQGSAGYLFLIYPAAGIILATLFVKYFVRDNISEGVTRVLYAISKKDARLKPHNCYSSVVGGAITIGFGGSVGPEAPIVLTGSAIGSNIAQAMRLNYRNTTLLLACGAAAAIAAIFKAPITGLIFVLEVLMLDISMTSIVPLLISSVIATTLSLAFNGFDPMFNVNVGNFKLQNLHYYALLAVVCGFAAYYFTTVNGLIYRWFARFKKQYQKWLWGGLILGALIFLFPPLYGEGYDSFPALMHGRFDTLFNNSLFFEYRDIPWVVLLFLVATLMMKVIAMSVTNAAGGVGGTFAPSLFVGAFTGASLAFALNMVFDLDLPVMNFTLVGMAGVMTGVMKAPLTSVFLIAELSNGYGLFVPLMLVASLSFALSYWLEPDSIYTKKLRERGELLTHNKDRSALVFLRLEELMETDFHPLFRNATLGDVVEYMACERRNIFPVLDDNHKLLGIVQLDDLRADMFDKKRYSRRITNYMIEPPDVIMQHELVTEVLNKFEQSRVWMLPVVDKSNTYLGFISKSRILNAYRQQLMELSSE